MYHNPEGLMPSVNGVTYQACVKTQYCGHFYSSLCVNGHGWVMEYINPPMESGKYTPPHSSSLVHTHNATL